MAFLEPMAAGRYAGDVVQYITAVLSSNTTRIVSLNLGTQPTEMLTGLPGDVHGEYAHEGLTNPIAKEFLTEYTRVHAMQLDQLLSASDSIPNPHEDGEQGIMNNMAVSRQVGMEIVRTVLDVGSRVYTAKTRTVYAPPQYNENGRLVCRYRHPIKHGDSPSNCRSR